MSFYKLFFIISMWHCTHATLVYPAASVLQITCSLSVPIELPDRKLFWDWGLQMNYDLPSSRQQIYNAAIWPGTFDLRKRRSLANRWANNATLWQEADIKYGSGIMDSGKHPSDFSAGELYHSFENLLVSYGFHDTCLLRSVCELAHHPFPDDQKNILTEILTFILTPSLHEAFAPCENEYRMAYEEAEQRGFLHHNCAALYRECKRDLLTSISSVVTKRTHHHNYDI